MRLLDRFGNHWSSNSPFRVGEIWSMRYRERVSARPHVEDVCVKEHRLMGRVAELKALVLERVRPWCGGPEALFDGTVRSTKAGTAYIPWKGPLPGCSTAYWAPDEDLIRQLIDTKVRFVLTGKGSIKRLSWVGVQEPPERIPTGALVRVSLSRRFGSETAPEGYYVQISGVL